MRYILKSKFIFSLFIIGALIISSNGTVSGSDLFNDLEGYWAKKEIFELGNSGIVTEYSNGKFEPELETSRGVAAKWIVNALGEQNRVAKDPGYVDVQKSHPYYKEIAIARELNIFKGYGDGRLGPDDHLTRAQMAAVIAKAFQMSGTRHSGFSDVRRDHWARKEIIALADYEITLGYSNGKFGPDDKITRGQFAVFISRALAVNELKKGLKTYQNSNFTDGEYIAMTISDENYISLKGKSLSDDINWIWFEVRSDQSLPLVQEIFDTQKEVFDRSINLQHLSDGKYKISIFGGTNRYGSYDGLYWDIPMIKESNEIYFPASPIYVDNYMIFRKEKTKPSEHINLNYLSDKEKQKLVNLAIEITKESKTDYEKILAISSWVSDNIYYDWDGYLSGNYGKNDAISTLELKRAVCQGYAELNAALIKSAGIPAKVVSGYALGYGANGQGWNQVNHNNSNHAWNEVFVDNRWIIIDTTWNSKNSFRNKEYVYGGYNYRFFDPTLEVFSFTHKILNR